MTFSEKLSALMSVTDVSCAALARALDVDRSTVSRFRSGTRGLPKLDTVRKMSVYLARNTSGFFRLNSIAELVGMPPFAQAPSDEQLIGIIYSYLTSQKATPPAAVGQLLKSISVYLSGESDVSESVREWVPSVRENSFVIYHGNAGKRRAVLDMIAYILQNGRPCELQVFTDEDMIWSTEQPQFSEKLMPLLRQLAGLGCNFKRIQPSVSGLEYALQNIERWLPVIMTGKMEQYFYPYPRDGLHRRTIYTASGEIALFSASVSGQHESLETVLTTEKSIVTNHERAFEMILERCRPTMKVSTIDDPDEMFTCLTDIAETNANGLYQSNALSLPTVPSAVVERIASGDSEVSVKIVNAARRRIAERLRELERYTVTDIMYLRPLSEVMAGRAILLSTGLLPDGPYYYTPEEYAMHLENVIRHLETYPRYHAVLTEDQRWNNIIIYAKEGAHVLLVKDSAPCAVFRITEQTMSDSIWNYMQRVADSMMFVGERQATINRLKDELSRLKYLMRRA